MIRRGNFDASQAFEDAWQARDRRASSDAEVRDLVRTAELICRSAVVEPSADFRATLRERLMAEAADVLVDHPVVTTAPARPVRVPNRRRRLVGLTAALVTSVGAVGTVASSASAVPGDALYSVKRGVENVQVAFHRSEESRGEYRLQQARERLAEAQVLDDRGDAERLASTLNAFTTQAEEGTDHLFDAYQAEQSTATIDKVNTFVAEASLSLASLSDAVPANARDSFASATTLITGLADQATQLCGACSTADISSLLDTVGAIADGASKPPVTASVPDTAVQNPASVTDPVKELLETPVKGVTGGSTGGGTKTPTPAPTKTPATGLTGVVSGTLDAVVGEQGLVTGLLNGLLGGGKK